MGIVSQQFSQSCIHCTKNDSMQGCANWFGGFNDGLIYIIYGTFPLQTKNGEYDQQEWLGPLNMSFSRADLKMNHFGFLWLLNIFGG